jgi:poly-gamma-glutamate synthesis protein (capsule biosynthesis protein)
MDLLLVGDVMLGRLVNEGLRHRPPASPWGDTLAIFRRADWRMCNLECVLADGGTPWSLTPKVFHFRSDAKNLAVLQAAGIDALSLANNHTLDFGYGALAEMLATLDRAGLAHAGAGPDLAGAARPAISETPAGRIAVIAFTDNEPAWEATAERAGVFYVPVDLKDARAAELIRRVGRTRADADFLIVSAHWGPNWGYRPPAEHVPFAHALIDAGADLVHGHSGHVVRGVEVYRGRPILYCTGDFVDDYAVDAIERNDQSFVFVVETDLRSVLGLRLYPTVIRDFQARLAGGREQTAIAGLMSRLCADLGTPARWDDPARCLRIALE